DRTSQPKRGAESASEDLSCSDLSGYSEVTPFNISLGNLAKHSMATNPCESEVEHSCGSKGSTDRWNTVEYYAAEKINDIMKFAGKWMELENIILSEWLTLVLSALNILFNEGLELVFTIGCGLAPRLPVDPHLRLPKSIRKEFTGSSNPKDCIIKAVGVGNIFVFIETPGDGAKSLPAAQPSADHLRHLHSGPWSNHPLYGDLLRKATRNLKMGSHRAELISSSPAAAFSAPHCYGLQQLWLSVKELEINQGKRYDPAHCTDMSQHMHRYDPAHCTAQQHEANEHRTGPSSGVTTIAVPEAQRIPELLCGKNL
ncbi:hypothetical protein STEG23_029243, partial [Scotinomys teguina]